MEKTALYMIRERATTAVTTERTRLATRVFSDLERIGAWHAVAVRFFVTIDVRGLADISMLCHKDTYSNFASVYKIVVRNLERRFVASNWCRHMLCPSVCKVTVPMRW